MRKSFFQWLWGTDSSSTAALQSQLESVSEAKADGKPSIASPLAPSHVRILKRGPAMRVIFFYPGEEGTYIDNANVTLFENGIIHIQSQLEETTTHLQNCEILWNFENEADERQNKVRLLKPKKGSETSSDPFEPEPRPTV
jgi:hypothetical protein